MQLSHSRRERNQFLCQDHAKFAMSAVGGDLAASKRSMPLRKYDGPMGSLPGAPATIAGFSRRRCTSIGPIVLQATPTGPRVTMPRWSRVNAGTRCCDRVTASDRFSIRIHQIERPKATFTIC
jgi:hypothetical protein